MFQKNSISKQFFFSVMMVLPTASYSMEQKLRGFMAHVYWPPILHNYLRDNNLEKIAELLHRKDAYQEDKNEVLCFAAREGSPAAVALALDNGAQAGIINRHQVGNNSLISSVFYSSYGFDPLFENVTDEQRELNIADIIERLIQSGADINKKDVLKRWHFWEVNGEIEGTFVEVAMPPLIQAVYHENIPLIKKLLDLRADIYETDSEGNTVWSYAELASDDVKKVLAYHDTNQ